VPTTALIWARRLRTRVAATCRPDRSHSGFSDVSSTAGDQLSVPKSESLTAPDLHKSPQEHVPRTRFSSYDLWLPMIL